MTKTIEIKSKNIRKNADWDPVVRVDRFPRHAKMNIIDAEELITPLETVSIKFDYPLSQPAILVFNNTGGFTRLDLFRVIYLGYSAIYAEEEGAMERDEDMPHGIWGHAMDDLVIEEVKIHDDGFIELEIGS